MNQSHLSKGQPVFSVCLASIEYALIPNVHLTLACRDSVIAAGRLTGRVPAMIFSRDKWNPRGKAESSWKTTCRLHVTSFRCPSAHPRKRILFTGLYYCRSFDTSDFTLSTQLPFLDSPAMSRFKMSAALWDRIHHFASFPQTGGTLGS